MLILLRLVARFRKGESVIKKKYMNPPELFDSLQYGFSQIVISEPGHFVFVSGQVGWNQDQEFVRGKSFKAQLEQAIKNIEVALSTANASLSDVVFLRIYIVGENAENDKLISSALRKHFGRESLPATTWLRVDGLASKELSVELEATAIIV